ncbi:MAG: ABC transporter ATP-binding protein [Chthoniobacterales bacterium]
MATVSVQNVSKIFPTEKGANVTAIKDLNLEIADREFVVLLGPSGCGKSTILRMIAGLEEISQGEILIGDKRVNDLAPKDRDIAMVFQNYALYPHLSVYDNLAFGLKLRKFKALEIKKRVTDAAQVLGLGNLLERKPRELSGGEQQRVAVGRAIVRQPKVFLFDEPLSNLDAKLRTQLRAEMVGLHQRLQATMIYVTHDQVEAMSMAERIVVLHGGAIQQTGAPLELYQKPANLFVAGFLGSPPMNLISGTLKEAGDQLRFREIEGGTMEVVLPAADRPEAREFIGKNVILGLRPEDLAVVNLSRKETHAAGNGFRAIVDVVEPMGAETILYLHTGAHPLVSRSSRPFDRAEAGHRFQFEIILEKAHLFDPATSNRLN